MWFNNYHKSEGQLCFVDDGKTGNVEVDQNSGCLIGIGIGLGSDPRNGVLTFHTVADHVRNLKTTIAMNDITVNPIVAIGFDPQAATSKAKRPSSRVFFPNNSVEAREKHHHSPRRQQRRTK